MLKLVLLVLSLESVAGEDTYTCDAGDLRYLMARVITIRKETDNQIKNLKTIVTTNLDETNRYIDQLNSTLGAIEDQLNNITKIIDIDECASSPCLNGATCNDQVNGYMCTCTSDWKGTYCEKDINANDCIDIRRNGFKSTGVYKVTLRNTRSVIQVFCDMSTDNGGWTVFKNRFNGSVDFYQNFSTYESGFGDLNGEFWLGLKYVQEMTAGSRTELRIDLTAADGTRAYEVFRNFFLTAGPDYRLNIDPGTGTAESAKGAEILTCDQSDLGSLIARLNTVRTEIHDQFRNLKETIYASNTTLSKQMEETILRIDYLNGTMGVIKTNIEKINRILKTDECASNPCSNNATCLDGINRYSCKCGPGYNGTQCQMNIDECASSPCLNGATCNDQVNGYMCTCTSDWTGTFCDQYIEKNDINDCIDLRRYHFKSTGVYKITLWNTRSVIQVFCDMGTDNGGWTVFQNRFNGSVDFYQNFSTYERGFGDLNGEFWLGLKYIQEMTASSRTELRIDLTAADGSTAYEIFQNFYLTAGPNYTLFIDTGTGTAGDSQGLSYNKGFPFSTFDRDVSGYNCAYRDNGGWWYGSCAFANLNGEYSIPGTVNAGNSGERGMTYRQFQGVKSLKTSKMMFRRF